MPEALIFLLPALKALAMLFVGFIGGGWLRRPLARLLEGRLDPTFRSLMVALVRPAAVVITLPPALDALGVSMSSAIALVSTVGLAIALALRDSLSNVASGAILLSIRPFGVGDYVTLGPVSGRVHRVGFLTTVIDTDEGRRVQVTNDKVLANPMELHAVHGRTRVEVVLRVPVERLDGALVARLEDGAREVGGPHAEVVPVEVEGDRVRLTARGFGPVEEAANLRTALLLRMVAVLRDGPGRV